MALRRAAAVEAPTRPVPPRMTQFGVAVSGSGIDGAENVVVVVVVEAELRRARHPLLLLLVVFWW